MDSEESLPADGSSGSFNPGSNGSICDRRAQHRPQRLHKCTTLGRCTRKLIVLSALQAIETRK